MFLPKVFYGWRIVAAGIGIATMASTFFVYGFSAFFIPWRNEFGWSRGLLGGVVGLSRLEGGLVAPISGYLVDKYGPRKIMYFGVGLMGIGFILLRWVQSLSSLYLVFLLFLAMGSSFGTGRPLQVAVANWFIKKRGRAMGFLMSGYGLGGSIVFIFAMLIDNLGWKTATVIAGLCMWGIGFPLISILRHKPEQMGLLPDGAQVNKTNDTISEFEKKNMNFPKPPAHFWNKDSREELELNVWQALRTRAFWMLAIVYAIFSGVPGITTVHLAPFLAEELGLEYVVAVAALSLFVFTSVGGRILFGIVADYVNLQILVALLFCVLSFSLFLFSTISNLSQVPLYVCAFGLAYGGVIPLRAVIQGYFFGRKSFGTIGGLLQFVDLPATVAAPIWIGFLADSLPGGYRIGFKAIAFIIIFAAIAVLFARRPQEPLPNDKPPKFIARFFK